MSDEQLQQIIDNIKTNNDIESLLYLLIDSARDNNQQTIDVDDIRTIVDEL